MEELVGTDELLYKQNAQKSFKEVFENIQTDPITDTIAKSKLDQG